MKKALLILLLFISAGENYLSAQILSASGEPGEENGVNYSFAPVLGYSSDTSLIGGVLLQRFNYGDGSSPFLSNLKVDLVASLKGDLLSEISFQRTRTLGTDIRSEVSLIAERYRQAHYFGIGNQTHFSEELYDQNYYLFEKKIVDLSYRARKTVAEFGFEGNFDLYAGFGVSYLVASERQDNSLYAIEEPLGEENARWVNTTGIGLIAEDRDSEFNPTEGYRYETGMELSGAYTGSEYDFTRVHADLRHYVEILPNLVLAQKIQAVHLFGDPPFWKHAVLGDKYGLRGFHFDRFLGNSSVLHVLEARAWLFTLFEGDIRVGGQFFWDSGRVFSGFDSNGFFDNWNHSFGAGGVMSLFNPDFILRGDLGFSNEAVRIYIGTGYIF